MPSAIATWLADNHKQLLGTFFSVHSDGTNARLAACTAVDEYYYSEVPSWGSGDFLRDPSIVAWNGKYYVAYSLASTSGFFGLLEADAIGSPWTDLSNVPVGSDSQTWAPEWFVDPADGSLHILVAMDPGDGNFVIHELHPTDPTNLATTGWSTPVALTGANTGYDPFVFYDSASSTYYLFRATFVAGSSHISYQTASSLMGTYGGSTDFSSEAPNGEGPCLLKVGSTYLFYYDNSNGAIGTGQIKYITSTDLSTWSSPVAISIADLKQGTVVIVPNPPGEDSMGNIRWDQIRSSDRQGTGLKGQAFSGSDPVSGNCAVFDADGNVQDGGSPPGGALTKIAEQILGSPESSVTFSSIPGTFRNLRLKITASNSGSSGSEDIHVQFNGDSGSNYDWILMYGGQGGGNQSSYGQTAGAISSLPDTTGASNSAGSCDATIFDYARTQFLKNYIATTFRPNSSSNQFVMDHCGDWRSTAAITSIVLLAASGNFIVGSVFSLYGES